MRRQALWLCSLVLACGCEDGPDEIFRPLEGDPAPQNGLVDNPVMFVPGDSKGFDDQSALDDVGRAKFCPESDETALAQQMVLEPLVPDVSAGGLPLWSADGGALYADDLLGLRSEGKFCNPSATFADAFAWGPTQDVVLLFDPETRLVEGVIVTQQYLGALQGSLTEGEASIPVVAQPRERLKIGGEELDVYASRAQAPNEPRSWLNPVNVNRLYRMVRETFFGATPPPDLDCVAVQVCDIVYTGANEETPQRTVVALRDSGVSILFTPEGQAEQILLEPVRSAPFENGGAIVFGAPDAAQMSFGFQSQLRETCVLDLDGAVSWQEFQARCIGEGDERVLSRVNYNVDTARDAVAVEFNGITLSFMRDITQSPLLADGEQPGPSDTLYSFSFSRIMPAPVAEFRPLTLATAYKERLEARLRAAVTTSTVDAAPGLPGAPAHPFSAFTLDVPFDSDAPQRLSELVTADGVAWIPSVLGSISAAYGALSAEERAALDPRVTDPIFLIEPFVDAVLSAFSHGESDAPTAVKAFRATADRRTSVGFVSFVRDGVPYRLGAQYSFNFGAVTAVTISRGGSSIDRLIDGSRVAPATPYFESADMLAGTTLSLGSNAIRVDGFDRRLSTVDIAVTGPDGEEASYQVSGTPLEDFEGYARQLRGERFEFVPAHQVNLLGKETTLALFVRQDGRIGRIDNPGFKGALELCPGLPIRYGDDVRQALLAWQASVGEAQYRACDVVFNYSANGNVLVDITSIANRRSLSLVDGRATAASVWL